MRSILITGAGGDVACAIIRCLLDKNKDDKIYGIDIKKYTPYMNLMTKSFVAPRYTEDEYMPFIKRLIVDYNITHFLPVTEQEIMLVDKERSFFTEQDVKVLINNEKIIDVCTSKYKTVSFLKNNLIDVPETFYAEDYFGELGYPFIMKSDSGCGSKNLKIIHNMDEWEAADKQGMICQQMIGTPDSEYTIGVFSDGNVINTITLKRQLGYGGLSALVECCDIPKINDIAVKIAKIFDLKGALNIQLRKDKNKYFIFEINPRLSSTTGFRHKFEFKDAVWWINMVDGKDIQKFENHDVGSIGVKVMDDIVISANRGGYWTSRIIQYLDNSCQVMIA